MPRLLLIKASFLFPILLLVACGGGAGTGGKGVVVTPATPSGLTATAANGQVNLAWTAVSGATSYNVKRTTTNGGPYTTVSSPVTASFSDTGLTNFTTYYYCSQLLAPQRHV